MSDENSRWRSLSADASLWADQICILRKNLPFLLHLLTPYSFSLGAQTEHLLIM